MTAADAARKNDSRGDKSDKCKLVSVGASAPIEIALDRARITVGSHPGNALVLNDSTVSRRHAVIACDVAAKHARYLLTDLDSTNGTFVNGQRIAGATALKRGDEVRFGSVHFAFTSATDTSQARDVSRTRRPFRRVAILLIVMFAVGFFAVMYRDRISADAADAYAAVKSRIWPAAARPPIAANGTVDAPAVETGKVDSAPIRPAIPDASLPGWLRRLNFYRAMAHLPPVTEDPELSKGDRAHALYVVRNYRDAIEHGSLGAEMHTEDPANSLFTPEGLQAAKSSDLDGWYLRGEPNDATAAPDAADPDEWKAARAPGSPEWSVDGWISIPFHRMPMLNPALKTAGFGHYCESGACASGLNLTDGASQKTPSGPRANGPIVFPPNGSTIPIRSFGNEWPDPRTSCTGYEPPSGMAITLELGSWMESRLSDYTVSLENADGSETALDACGFDSSSYANPDAYAQQLGREILKNYGAVVVIPREPLAPNSKYDVAITANDKLYHWTFSTGP